MLGNDGNWNVGLFGFDSAGNMVVKVAKPGFNADTASDANLIFNSSQNVLKVVGSGTAQLTAVLGTSVATSASHSLGYIPAAIVHWHDTDFFGPGTYLPSAHFEYVSSTNNVGVIHWVDSTNISFQVTLGSGAGSTRDGVYGFKYYLLQESAS